MIKNEIMNKMKYYLSLFVLSVFIMMNTQVNANDVCSGAIQLTVDAACIQENNINSTPDIHNSCAYNKYSVWYSFDVTQSGSYGIEISNSTFNDVLTLYSGSCGTLSEIACTNTDEFGFEGEKLYENLTPGTYYLMVSGADCTFGNVLGYFCIQVIQNPTLPPTVVNEECDMQPTNVNLTSGTPVDVTGSTLHASTADPNPLCSPHAGASVWYVLNGASNTIKVSSAPNMTEIITLYSGTCNNLTEIGCKVNEVDNPDPLIIDLTGYTAPYYMQVAGSFVGIETDFNAAISATDFYIEVTSDFNCSAYNGTACNDNNPATTNDVWNSNCECAGTCDIDAGTICDDGNPNTVSDTWDTDCNCVGTCSISSSDCPSGTTYNAATCSCDCTLTCPNGQYFTDNCTCEPCPLAGTSCDDGNDNNYNDTWDANCNCVGECPQTVISACSGEYVLNENCDCICLQAGMPCDDGNAGTENDMWTFDCECIGTTTCEDIITITQADVATEYFEASNLIKTDENTGASVIVNTGETLTLKATNRVRINPGLSIQTGATFRADNDGCQ